MNQRLDTHLLVQICFFQIVSLLLLLPELLFISLYRVYRWVFVDSIVGCGCSLVVRIKIFIYFVDTLFRSSFNNAWHAPSRAISSVKSN